MSAIIEAVVRPSSHIHSDKWRAYRNIQHSMGFFYHKVNDSLHFVDPKTGTHELQSLTAVKKNLR